MDSYDITQIVDKDEQKELSDEYDIELIDKIDEGSFGVVFKGRDLSDNTLCAVKVTQSYKEKYSCIETSIIRSLDHPNIVKFKKFIELHQNKYIIMEYIGCGTLYQLIEDRKVQNKPFSENEISTIMNSLVSALKCMHENNVIHRDIKPENILLGSREDLAELKLSDFGLSVKYQDGVPFKQYSQKCGTVIFMAPEILAEKQYSKPVDVWSCGIILYMLFTMGKHPFKLHNESRDDYVKKLISLDPSKEELEDVFPSELAKDLFLRMINKEPTNRYTASQVLKHPFITRKLNSNIPLSFQENTRIFQNQRNLAQTIKTMLVLQFIQQKSTKQQDMQNKQSKINCSPIKMKSQAEEKDCIKSPHTDRTSHVNRRVILHDGNRDDQFSDNLSYDSPLLGGDDMIKNQQRIEGSPIRHIRISSNRIQDPIRSLHSAQLPSHQNMKLKLQIPSIDNLQQQKSQSSLKSQTNSPIQTNSAYSNQSRDGQSPQKQGLSQNQQTQSSNLNNYSKFYNESPISSSQKSGGLLPAIGKSPQNNQQLAFFAKKDINNYQGIFFPNNKNTPLNSQKLSSHGQRAQRVNIGVQQQPQQSQNQILTQTQSKTNSLQRPIQTSNLSQNMSSQQLQGSMTSKQVRKSSQNFQIKLITTPHNNSVSSSNSSNSAVGVSCGPTNTQNENIKTRHQKQQSFHKQVNPTNGGESFTSSNSNQIKLTQQQKIIPKSNSQTTLYSKDSRPGTRQKDSYKPSQFSQQVFRDSDIVSPQTHIQQAFSFHNFNHNQRVLTESRKPTVQQDSFEYLECEENI